MTDKKVMQMALDALKFYANPTVYDADSTGRRQRITFVADDAIIAIEAAIAQPVQPATEFTSTMYDPAGLSNWLVGHDKGVRVTHRSGVFEQCHTERGFHANEAIALERLQARLEKKYSL